MRKILRKLLETNSEFDDIAEELLEAIQSKVPEVTKVDKIIVHIAPRKVISITFYINNMEVTADSSGDTAFKVFLSQIQFNSWEKEDRAVIKLAYLLTHGDLDDIMMDAISKILRRREK